MFIMTRQEEYLYDLAEPAPRDQIIPTTLRPPDPQTEWQRPAHVVVGTLYRVDTIRLDAFDDEIRHQAERDLARLRQRHMDHHAEDARALMYNEGSLPTENINEVTPQ